MQGYNKIDKFIHQHCQTISKFGRSFAEAKADDSHTNLGFDVIGKTVWGRWVKVLDQHYMLGLDLTKQQFVLVDKNKSLISAFEMRGKSQAGVEQNIATFLTEKLSLEGKDFLKPLHYEIPLYDFFNEVIPAYHVDLLDLWIKYRALSKRACLLLIDHLQTAAEIRIWPHHFDTSIYFEYDTQIGVGYGLAMADSMILEAYFYYRPYGLNDYKFDYSNPCKLSVGKWVITEEWKGAVLPSSEATEEKVATFIKETTSWVLEK